jgi:hypothetical protein
MMKASSSPRPAVPTPSSAPTGGIIISGGTGGGDPLAFSDAKQNALLGHAIHDRLFFLQVRPYLEPNWFTSPGNQKLWALLQRFYESTGRYPHSAEELLSCKDFQAEDEHNRSLMSAAYLKARGLIGSFGVELLTKEFSLWAQAILFEKSIKECSTAYNQKRPEDAIALFREGYKRLQKADFMDMKAESWDLQNFHDQQKLDNENGMTFGLPQLDRVLNPSAPEGALLRGDTTIIMAPINVGKTTAMLTVVAHNIARGKNVLLLTHEGRSDDLKFKILCCLLQVTKEEFFRLYLVPTWRQLAEYWSDIIRTHLTYIVMNSAFTTVNAVEAVVRRQQELRKLADPEGHGYDLLVDDYPAKLWTEGMLKGDTPRRINDEQVYGCFVSMALDYGFHAVLAVQTNREGSKINRGQTAPRLLTMEDVMESWGVMAVATNVLTLNCSPYDRQRNRVTWYLCKSRSSEVDWAFTCKSDPSRSTTHAPAGWPEAAPGIVFPQGYSTDPGIDMTKYGCTAYRGTEATTTAQLDALIDKYRGRTIDAQEMNRTLRGTFTRPIGAPPVQRP